MKLAILAPEYTCFSNISLVLIAGICFISCRGQKQVDEAETLHTNNPVQASYQDTPPKSYGVSDGVSCGFLDKEGILWFGTNNEGIYRYDGTSFTNYSEQEGLCNKDINSIIEDSEGNLWFGTPEGFCKYDRKSFTQIPLPWADTSSTWLDKVYPIINPNEVLCMLQDKQGTFWLGTNGSGAYRYDGQSFTQFLAQEGRKQIDSLYHNIIMSMVEDTAGNIWFSSRTHGGISRYDGETFSHFTLKNRLRDDMFNCSLLDSKGNLWFGSLGNRAGGLHKYEGKAFINFNQKKGLLNNNITSLYEDKKGNLWIGSDRASMSMYDGETFSPFTTKEGRTFERIRFITEDAIGNIWFGGNYGKLFRYDGNTVTDFTQKGR